MALRRPPTRIELKTEDIEEYEQVRQNLRSFLSFGNVTHRSHTT